MDPWGGRCELKREREEVRWQDAQDGDTHRSPRGPRVPGKWSGSLGCGLTSNHFPHWPLC